MYKSQKPDSATAPEPIVQRPKQAMRYGGYSRDQLYAKIASGELESFLDGRKRYITTASIKADRARQVAAAAAKGFERGRCPTHPGNQQPAT